MNSKVTLPGYPAIFSLSRGWHGLSALIVATLLMACGGGGGSTPAEIILTLGGSISGLGQTTGLTLVNGAETLVIAAGANAFTFATQLAPNVAYNVTVGTQPNGLTCSVTNGSGTMAGAVNAVVVSCVSSEIGSETSTPTIALFAGSLPGDGSADGIGAAASFRSADGIATDSTGNVYVADTGNHIIRKITPTGMVSTLAGTRGIRGDADGVGAAAQFSWPRYLATDSANNVYVTDSNWIIRKITPAGVVSTLAGTRGERGNTDRVGAAASFEYPEGIATDNAGNIYVADSRIIRKITPAGVVSTLAGTQGVHGNADGVGAAASFVHPAGLATDSTGNVYVADSNFGSSVIRKITPTGVVSTLAGTPGVYGNADGVGAAASFANPTGIATDSAGNVYVSSTYDKTIRKITPSGVVSTLAGMPGTYGTADGIGAGARFRSANGVATDSAGNIFVADSTAIRKVTTTGIVSTWAGATGPGSSSDGIGSAASFYEPTGIAADSAGNVYVADRLNRTIRKITPAGMVSTLAGTPGGSGSADGIGPSASFSDPKGIATDKTGNVYVTESTTIRKITPAGMVSTLAGTAGIAGSANGIGAATRFNDLAGIATDSAGNVFVTDRGNHTIRKITPVGIVSTLAGTAGIAGSANGIGAAASFDYPSGIASDSAGNVYVVDGKGASVGYGIDGESHRVDAVSSQTHAIRKITPDGLVSTVLSPLSDLSYLSPTVHGIAIDSAGNIYESIGHDQIMAFYHLAPYSTIRKTTPAGVVSTVVGVPQKSDFVSGPLPGSLREAGWLAISGTSLYITMPNAVVVVRNMP